MAVVQTVTRLFLSHSRASCTSRILPVISMKHASTASNYQFILTEKCGEKKNVALITLNRPKQFNVVSAGLLAEMANAVQEFDKDESIAAIVVTGSEKAFAAGADLKEMQGLTYVEALKYTAGPFGGVAECKKPVIAAVNGLAFGGGSELAMACDIIYAGEKATFCQPEVSVGVIPGAGGTQRLPRFIGKSKAMEMILSGTPITAQEAEKAGLVSRVFPTDKVVEEAIKLGEKIARHSRVTVALCKQSVKAAYETTMSEGLKYEKSVFHGAFATNDQKEGMKAFIEKRPAKFTNS